jgi:hypothetical protein
MGQEVIYARRLLEKLGFPQPEPTVIYEDSRTRLHPTWSDRRAQWVAATVPLKHTQKTPPGTLRARRCQGYW